MERQYLRVINTSAQLDPEAITTALGSLYKLSTKDPAGRFSQVNPFQGGSPITFEFVVASEGEGRPVEFYYGADDQLDVLHQRLRSMYPASFDIDTVVVDLVEMLLHDDGGGRQSDEVSPYGVQWRGKVDRRKDWMTTLSRFSQRSRNDSLDMDTTTQRAPLAPLVDLLTRSSHRLAFQVVFKRKPDWSRQAKRRAGALLGGRDTLLQQVVSLESVGGIGATEIAAAGGSPRGSGSRRSNSTGHSQRMRDRERDQKTVTRLDHIRSNDPKRTFTVNARLLAFPTEADDRDSIEAELANLCAVLDPIDGQYYEIEGQILGDGGTFPWPSDRSDATLDRFRQRSIETRRRDRIPRPTNRADSRPDLILNADELANLVSVPSAADLTVEGSRGTRAEQRSRNPLPRPHHDITRRLREPGQEIGHLLDENREPESEPMRLSPELLPFHVGRFAKTGAGKSIALINDALSLVEQTSGPVFLIDTKGGGLPQNYMRAHGQRFGFEDLEKRVIHFDIPDRLPGFAFFNIQPALANGVPRMQAIKDRVDHYVEVLKMTMGEERFEQAVVSPNLLRYLIRLMYDEEHGLDHGLYRESTDYFGQSQLEQVVDQLYESGPPQPTPEEAPKSSREEVTSKIHRHLTADPRTFANIMGGVSNRMDYITADPFLQRIFNTTEPRFDMREVLDEDVVVIFDLGDLRSDAAKVMAGVILTNLYDAVTERDPAELAATPDDYVANLLIDEAASIVVSEVLNDLLEQGREFQLSVELVSQFPEQMELEGDREVYLNVLNNIGAPIVGKIAVDDEIARALAHEDMDPAEFRNRVRALPRGEWIAQVPSPAFGETGPMPFSVEPLSIPAGHPESGDPLTAAEEQRFEAALDGIHQRTQAEYGVPIDAGQPTARVPDGIQETLAIATDGLDELLAVMTRYVQLREGLRETNGAVSVRDVDDLLEAWYETPLDGSNPAEAADEDGTDAPSRQELAEIRDRSPLFELSVDTERGETVMQLTETGEWLAQPETGNVQAAGGPAHDDALARVETAFTRAGYLVAPVQQDGSRQPDAWAIHPDIEVPLAVEVETTTHTKPAKVLRNLAKAQAGGAVPVFVAPAGADDDSNGVDAIANRIANILDDPVKDRDGGAVEYYLGTDHVTFNGGAEADNGVTAVRPVATDSESRSNRTRWRREKGRFVLTDETGTVHARVANVDQAPKEQFPATYSIDADTGTVTVSVPGELPRTYESEAAFREAWVPIKRPVIPEVDLPVPDYERESYVIGVLLEGDQAAGSDRGDLAVYQDGDLHSITFLTEALQEGDIRPITETTDTSTGSTDPTSPPEQEEHSSANPDPVDSNGSESGVESFASERLVEEEGHIIPFREVYDLYEAFVEENQFEAQAATHFTLALSEYVSVESELKWHEGETQQCYIGVRLAGDDESGGEAGG